MHNIKVHCSLILQFYRPFPQVKNKWKVFHKKIINLKARHEVTWACWYRVRCTVCIFIHTMCMLHSTFSVLCMWVGFSVSIWKLVLRKKGKIKKSGLTWVKFYLNLFLFFSQDIFSSSFTSCLPFSGVVFFFPSFPFSFSSAAVTEKVCVEASELVCACRGKVCRCVCFWRLVRERLCFVLPISVSVLLQLTEWLREWEREGGSVCLWVCERERDRGREGD